MQQQLGAIMQMAYIVENLEQAIEQWCALGKAGPFTIMESFDIENMAYRGETCESLDLRLALGNSDGLCIEFIEQKCDTPSVYRDVIASRGYGFHHWAYITKSFDYEVDTQIARGMEVAFSGKVAVGERYAYIDSPTVVHGMVEIIEYSQAVDELFTGIEQAARDWDGKQLILYA
jgi:hypothetical protein